MSPPSSMLSRLREAAGDSAWVVGGAVRDRLLGRDTVDIDVALAGDPSKAAERFASAVGGRAFPLHAELGILRVVNGPVHVDIAKIQGRSLEEDLGRRDFTINALAVPLSAWTRPSWKDRIVDLHGGRSDLRRKWIVPVSDRVFTDDPLRLLRAFRIAAELEFSIPAGTVRRISRHRALAKKPAPERLREEMLRTFSTPRSFQALEQMEKAGVLEFVFAPARDLRKTAPGYYGRGGVLRHTLDSVKYFEEIHATLGRWFPRVRRKVEAYLAEPVGGYPRSAHCKWGLLLHDIGKPKTARMVEGRLRFFEHEHVGADMVAGLAKTFRWSSDETSRYARLVRHHMRPGNLAVHPEATWKAFHRFFRDLGDDAVAMLLVSLADHLTYLTPAQRRKRSSPHERTTLKMMSLFYHQTARVLPKRLVTGHDIMEAFKLPPSPLIGRLLSEADDAQADRNFKTKEETLDHLRKLLPSLQAEAGKKA